MRIAQSALLLSVVALAAVAPGATAASCEHDEVRVERPVGKDGPQRNAQIWGHFRVLPDACRRSTWSVAIQLREDGKWRVIDRQALTRGELRSGFQTVAKIPLSAGDAARIRFRVTDNGRKVATSRSSVIDMTTFADMPSTE